MLARMIQSARVLVKDEILNPGIRENKLCGNKDRLYSNFCVVSKDVWI